MDTFITQALIFIGSSILLVPLFQRWGFGTVLGYLLAGVVVGPHWLGFIKDSESILHLAELGVVLLLFIIGLEIRPSRLWSMRKQLLNLGVVQVVSCTVVFWLIASFTGLSLRAAGTLGFALSLSSTAFVIQTLAEKNQLKSEFGRSAFSVLLTQDLLAIPALAILPALALKQTESSLGVGTLLAFFGIIGGLILIGRYVFPPLFGLIAKTHNKEMFTALTLFIVFGVAALMLKIGLSAALGTFIAGVLLSNSEYRHELEANLDPFKSLLMGLFFIGVGMSVSLELILEKPQFVFPLAVAYLVLKSLIIYGVGRASRLGHENSKLLGLNLAQGGEFAFVIFGILHFYEIAPQPILTLLTAVITISMALNPLMILASEYLTEKFPKEVQPKKYDEVKDESPEVIIAGFGRFGQMFGRILRSQQIPFVAIDHDADQIELVRKFGNKVYYGDVSRLELLHAAGTAKAKYFILAIDDQEQSLKTAKLLVEHFPNVKIFARARNRGHVFDYFDLGVEKVKRETIDSSLSLVADLLKEMGLEKEKANLLVQKFSEHDEIMLREQYKVRDDDKSFVSLSQQSQAQLQEILKNESLTSYIRPAATGEAQKEGMI